MNNIAEEFSALLMDLSKFWIPALLNADTGIGRTMRFLLKLEPSKAHPLILQYKGIEIRSFREKRTSKRNALCCMVPNWKKSNYKSSAQILEAYGYFKDGSKIYQNTVYCGKNNSQGLQLVVDEENDLLKLVDGKTEEKRKEVAIWNISKIKDYISQKHNETFWVECESKYFGEKEFFRITKAEHSLGPIWENLCDLIRQQMISLDIILGRKKGGDMFAFKLKAAATQRLFPQSDHLTYNNFEPMKYCDWNQLLINFYFVNKGDEPIFLAITKEELIDYAIENTTNYPTLLAKTNEVRRTRGDREYALEEYVWNDFKTKCSVTNKATLFSRLREEVANTQKDPNGMPHFLPLFALFMMPQSQYPELHAKDYYEHLEKFLREEHVINDKPSRDKNGKEKGLFNSSDFSVLEHVLKFMWSSMENWAQKCGFNYEKKREFVSKRGNEYVDMFQAECLFTSVQLDRFKIVFQNSSLSQDEEIEDERIVNILKGAYSYLGFNKDSWKGMLEKNRKAILSIFRREYEKWDGDSVIIIRDVKNRTNVISYGKTSNLYLGMFIMQDGSKKFFLDLFSKDNDDNDLMSFTSEDGTIKVEDIRITYSGFGNRHILTNPTDEKKLCEIVNSDNPFVLKDVKYKENKAIFKSNDLFLFANNSGTYTSRADYELGRQYFVLIKNTKQEAYDSWLQDNDAIRSKECFFDNKYTLYRIDCAKTELIGSKQLSQKHLVTIKLKHTIVLSKRPGEAIALCNMFDAYFSISGLNVSVDKVSAVSTEGKKNVIDLEYIKEYNLWKLTPPKNHIELSKEYMLCVNDSIIKSNRYKFRNFNMLDEGEYSEIEYDKLGKACDKGIYKGLILDDAKPSETDSLRKEIDKVQKEDIPKREYANADYFLYALSAFPILKRSDIKDILHSFFFLKKYKEPDESYYLNNILGDYFRLGYLNKKYEKGKHQYAINKPSLLWISPKFIKEKVIVSGKKFTKDKIATCYKCQEHYYKFLFTGARTPEFVKKLINGANGRGIKVEVRDEQSSLLPQTIIFHSPSLQVIEEFAKTYGLGFQKCIYANSMLKYLPTLTEYEKEILKDEIEMYERTRFRAIDYTLLAKKFAEGETYIENKSIETRTIDKNASFVTYYPGTYNEKCVIWKNGKAYETDKHWGHFLGLSYVGKNIISYDEETGTFSVPLQIKLPDLMARAITMITGELPVVENGKRVYKITLNPFAFKTAPNKIIERLKK